MAYSIRERFEQKFVIDPISDCHLWIAYVNKAGYGHFGLNGKVCDAHRVSYELYVSPIPKGQFVLHKCDVTSCVNPKHLFLGTQADNLKDMTDKGRRRSAWGEDSGATRLTALQVAGIRLDTRPSRFVAKLYGVGKSSVSAIRSGKSWRTA